MSARITASFAWDCAARWRGRWPRCVLTPAAPGFSSASVLMSRFVAYVFCAATWRGVRLRRSWTDAASGDPMARTVAMLWLTPGWAAARWSGVAPKLFVMLDAAFASGCLMRSLEIWGGASKSAQQWSGVSFSRFVARMGDVGSAPASFVFLDDCDDDLDLPWSCMRTSTILRRFLSTRPGVPSPPPAPSAVPLLVPPPPPSSTMTAFDTARCRGMSPSTVAWVKAWGHSPASFLTAAWDARPKAAAQWSGSMPRESSVRAAAGHPSMRDETTESRAPAAMAAWRGVPPVRSRDMAASRPSGVERASRTASRDSAPRRASSAVPDDDDEAPRLVQSELATRRCNGVSPSEFWTVQALGGTVPHISLSAASGSKSSPLSSPSSPFPSPSSPR
mmetsp:Transcript_7212/g.16750  ORF Transcript_7212/g.16750 Transcript_7212/m.16750 type:complete len:391 (+) Transcript_7212:511-1683(+)